MLTEISLQNFKLFREETRFPLGKITLLTGVNGRGKSTVLQPLLLMRQSIEHDPYTQSLLLNGSCAHLGEVRDVKNVEAGEEENISLRFKFSFIENNCNVLSSLFYHLNGLEKETKLKFNIINFTKISNEFMNNIYKGSSISNMVINFNTLIIEDALHHSDSMVNDLDIEFNNFTKVESNNINFNEFLFKKLNISFDLNDELFIPLFENDNFVKNIHYISADRLGPQDIYPRSNLGSFVNVGARGEHTATVLAQKQRELVAESLCLGEDARTVLQQTEEWLREIFGGAKLSVEVHRDFVDIGFNTRPDRNRYKPANVGFGYSYILPIIVSGLVAQPGELLIVENPEAHLHPRAQAALTRFLSKVAETGVQVFIESHSEHILNALRIVAKTPDIAISNTDISVLYFQDNDQEPFVPIPILPDGGIETWPQGFFDQTDKDYKELFGF